MRFSITILLLAFSPVLLGQTAPSQIKALNSYVDYANQSADEVTSVVKSIIDYYPSLHKKNSSRVPRYVCPVQLEDYYFNTAVTINKALEQTGFPSATKTFNELRTSAQKIDETCKALDTYHKLEDYKEDNFAKAETLIVELQSLIKEYSIKQQNLQKELRKLYAKITSASPDNAYKRFDNQMFKSITSEQNLLNEWTFNVNEEVHTGWPVEKLQQSILVTDAQLAELKKNNPALQYPASSSWGQFQNSLTSILEVKGSGLDKYNFEAKKSDKHSNDLYLELINYYNGTLIADYNTFLGFSERDRYFGLKAIKYVPVFEIRSQIKETNVEVKPFQDIPRSAIQPTPQKTTITKSVSDALSNYVEFINETWRQTRYMESALTSFNSSAAYFKTLDSYDKRAPMHFDYENYQVPLSFYQKTINSSTSLPNYSKSLNEQTEVLLNILKEMDELSASLEIEVKEKKYEQDHLKKVYSILERQAALFLIWDEKKELLYQDVRSIYNSYPVLNATNSWQISGKILRELTDIDHDALFQANAYYKGDSSIKISTEKIDLSLRNVIANEYDNMKGIQKIGRNNGLCPYTPYEDLPETSKQLSELFKKLKPATASRNSHPYHSMVYLYNDIVDDYNKFCELSTTVYHLPTIKQPELFAVKYPDPKPKEKSENPVVKNPTTIPADENKNDVISTKTDQQSPIRPVEKKSIQHDTVYIEKRDTVYLRENSEDLRSMEGYATNNMVLLLDVSGSMNHPDKLPLLKKSVLDLLSMMRQEDKITIIAFSGKPKVLLKSTSFKEEEKIKKAISDLSSSGKTDGNAGLKLAYKVADESYIRAGNNRIVLATDGEFVLNEETSTLIKEYAVDDIFLSVFSFGKGMGSSKALENLAKLGRGNYEAISKDNVEMTLIREVKAKKKK